MQKRVARGSILIAALTISACHKQATVPPPDSSLRVDTVTVQFVGLESDSTLTVDGVPIYFYPFDRDSLFDVLDSRAARPKPEIPKGLMSTLKLIQSLQGDWWQVEDEWTTVRGELEHLANKMYEANDSVRATPEYSRQYAEFERLDTVEQRLTDEKTAIFDEFTFLQDSITVEVEAYLIERDAWEDEAYASYFEVEQDLLQRLDRQVYSDTTDTAGYVRRVLPDGYWWVEVHTPSPVGEYYWNVRIDPRSVDTIRLDESNGEERIRL